MSVVEEDTKGKRVVYKGMHTLFEAEQKRTDKLSSARQYLLHGFDERMKPLECCEAVI